MRSALVIFLLLPILCASQSSVKQVCFTVDEAQHVLDSLYARGDWQRMYAIQTARLDNCGDKVKEYASHDELNQAQLAKCDSVVRHGFSKERALLGENAKFQSRSKDRKWWGVVGIIIGFVASTALK